jgi:hypothetical protein
MHQQLFSHEAPYTPHARVHNALAHTPTLVLTYCHTCPALPAPCLRPNHAAASFEWAQSAEEVLVRVAVPSDTTRHQVTVAVDPQQLAVLRGQHLLLGGCLQHMVVPQLCHWHLGGWHGGWARQRRGQQGRQGAGAWA